MHELEAELAVVAGREPIVRAWSIRLSDEALRAAVARASDGPLSGWTFGVKDVIDTADFPTERGSAIYQGRAPWEDAACVAMVKAAGAVIAGKTTTTEFALFAPTVTTNPHDPERTPGGSSSGSAAAVAAGMVRAAFGTQTVGSVLRPAAFCGVVGFKGTFGFVPMTGIGTLAHSLDTLGWHTRTVSDSAAIHRVMTGEAAPIQPIEPPTFGLYRSRHYHKAQPELEPLLGAVTDRLRAAGAIVIELDHASHLADVAEAGEVILSYESSRAFAWERGSHPDLIHPSIVKLFERGDSVSAAEYHWAQRAVAGARARHDGYLTDTKIDAILTPSAPGEAPPMATTGDSVFNRLWSTLGVPAIQIPVGTGPNRLPLGVQLTTGQWSDADLFAIASWLEAACTEPLEIR